MEQKIITEEWKPKVNPWLMAIPLMLGAFMEVLDMTIANVALPHMAGTFSISKEESMWILTSYMISSGIVIPSVDYFCKVLGRKNLFIICLVMFTMASFLCGLSKSIEQIILARILQGLGGGALMPIAQAIIIESFPPQQRGKSMAMFGLVIVMGPILGPVIGGLVTENWSWPYIFYINIPIGIIAFFLARKFLEDSPYSKKQKNIKIDKFGFFSLTGWLVTFQIVMDKGNIANWFGSTWVCWTSFASLIFFILFVYSQLKQEHPLCDLRIFKNRNFIFGVAMQMTMQGILIGSMAILPQFLQGMLGYNALLSGLALMPRGLGSFASAILYGVISNKISNKVIIAVGLILISISCWQLGSLNLQIAEVNISMPNFIFGLGAGLTLIPIIPLACSTLEKTQMTNASGLQNLMKSVGGAIGTSLVATAVSRLSQVHQHYLVVNLNPLNQNYIARLNAYVLTLTKNADSVSALGMAKLLLYKQLIQQSSLYAYMDSFKIFSILASLIIPLLLFIKSNKVLSRANQNN